MAAASASLSSEIANEGPVLNLINKRLRALRKKLNRISQMEESLSQGKILNKEQEETYRSKSAVLAGIDELEKIRQPILQAVDQEIEAALEKKKQDPEILTAETPNEEESVETVEKAGNDDVSSVSDLLNLLYFGAVFDVKTLMSAHDNMLTRTHERNCCLTYDYVTDDDAAGAPLKEWDLDLIAILGGSLISRPVHSSLSHKDSLQKCVEHAKLWLANSEQPIEPNSDITYAGLREKLNKIMASDYFTTTPEIKAPVEVAAAGGNYISFQVPVHSVGVEDSSVEYRQEILQEEQSPNSHNNEIYGDEISHVEKLHQGVKNGSEVQAQTEQGIPDSEVDQNSKEQQTARKPHQNYGGPRGGGSRRGYSNGRGGRGGRGGYQNGRGGQFYDQEGGYYPRNNYYRGRGGRGGNYNHRAASSAEEHDAVY
ncbi:hypothetical protein ABFS83_05G012100 [Erythranthe nasuta]